jgi:hypothetical protein
MTNIQIDNDALKIIMSNSNIKIILKCEIEEYKIKYLLKTLKDLEVSEETLKTLRILNV